MPSDPQGYAELLYDTLHRLDREAFDWIAVERPPATPAWAALLDRLSRAAALAPGTDFDLAARDLLREMESEWEKDWSEL